jgi:hypothetical protein
MAPEENNSAFYNAGIHSLKVPGFGLPIDFAHKDVWNHQDPSTYFSHGINNFRSDRMTVREVAMIKFMEAVTEKPDWNVKVFDQDIIKKWGEEAMAMPKSVMSEKAVQWCISELREKAKHFERDSFVKTLEGGSRCVKSDTIIPPSMTQELKSAIKPLLDVEPDKRDYHPNSNDQVLNLVHPSLYPLIYGKTRVLTTGQVGVLDCMESCGQGQLSEEYQTVATTRPGNQRMEITNTELWSRRFQWLPCEVKFQGDEGTDVKITSYINNIYPALHTDLYALIEKFISKSIPLWNEVLIKGDARVPLRIRTYGAETEPENMPDWAEEEEFYQKSEDEQKNEAALAKVREYMSFPDNPLYQPDEHDDPLPEDWENWEENSDWELYRVVKWKFERIRKIIHPEPGASFSYEDWKLGKNGKGVVGQARYGLWNDRPLDSYSVKLEEQFRAEGLQVIPKLSSIELTPDKPSYLGGNWHLEGMMNEHIVATAIYYYDVENVTPSHLRFRQEAYLDDMDLQYEQDEHEPLSVVFGTKSMRDEPAIQEVGSIATTNGRLLVFPNTMQHKVEPFELIDSSKPGHRRFLVLWLVDPHYRILSTANVPPQQAEWNGVMTEGWNRTLPQELSDMVEEHALKGQMSLDDAKTARLALMEERTVFGDTVEKNFEEYNLCEH